MVKFKHNKKRNTAFIYESLIIECAKSLVAKDLGKRNKIVNILKEHFGKGKELYKELKLYKELSSYKNVSKDMAEKIIKEAKISYMFLDRNAIKAQQDKLLDSVSKNLDYSSVFSNFVPSYKTLASISQIFNQEVPIKTRILLEQELTNEISAPISEQKKMVPISNIVLKSFSNRFNEQYKELTVEQKQLLSKYVNSFSDNGADLKIYLNEEFSRLKEELNKSLELKEIKEDPKMKEGALRILETLNSFKNKDIINEESLKKIIKIQNLVKELNSGDN